MWWIEFKPTGWKAKTLNFAGRVTLVKSVTSSIPVYSMHTNYIPRSICDQVEKLQRNFLWNDSNGNRKVHLVNWDIMCQPVITPGVVWVFVTCMLLILLCWPDP